MDSQLSWESDDLNTALDSQLSWPTDDINPTLELPVDNDADYSVVDYTIPTHSIICPQICLPSEGIITVETNGDAISSCSAAKDLITVGSTFRTWNDMNAAVNGLTTVSGYDSAHKGWTEKRNGAVISQYQYSRGSFYCAKHSNCSFRIWYALDVSGQRYYGMPTFDTR